VATDYRDPTADDAESGTWAGAAPGTRYTLVDDYPDSSGADYLTHGTTAGSLTLNPSSAFAIPAGATNISVQVLYYDQKTASQSCNIAARLKVGGNYYGAASHNPANGVWTSRSDNFATNPKTAAAWTVDDINGVGANALQSFGWVSTDANPTIKLASIRLQVTYTPPVTGDLAATEPADVAGASATVAWIATLAATEAPDTVAGASGTVAWIATLAATEAPDTAAFSGTVSSPAITGDMAAVETADSAVFSGTVSGGGPPPAAGPAPRRKWQRYRRLAMGGF
jgi:hypothetical protein